MAFAITAPHLDSKYKNITKAEFMPFFWDAKKQQKPKQTKAELQQLFKKWDKVKFKKQE